MKRSDNSTHTDISQAPPCQEIINFSRGRGRQLITIDQGGGDLRERGEGPARWGGSFKRACPNGTQGRHCQAAKDAKFVGIAWDGYRSSSGSIRKRKMYEGFLATKFSILETWINEEVDRRGCARGCKLRGPRHSCEARRAQRRLYIIVDGTASVTQYRKKERSTEVGSLGPATTSHEIALMLDRPRAATFTATGPLKCVKLDRPG